MPLLLLINGVFLFVNKVSPLQRDTLKMIKICLISNVTVDEKVSSSAKKHFLDKVIEKRDTRARKVASLLKETTVFDVEVVVVRDENGLFQAVLSESNKWVVSPYLWI